MNEKLDQNLEDVRTEELVANVDSDLVEVKETTTKKIKDYLSKDLFNGIKIISGKESDEEVNSLAKSDLSEYEKTFKDISENQIISAKVIGISENDIMVDIGFKSEGLINRSEFNNKDLPEIGSKIDIFLEKFEDTDGNITLSKYKADFIKRWDELRELCDNAKPVKGKIIKRVKGGLVVDLDVIQAFLPGSQVDVQPVKNFDDFLNKEFDFQIVKVDESRKNLVVSRKAILQESLNEKRQEIMDKIKVGETISGIVKNITDFGAFIDLGGVDGLIHITDFSWGRINHPTDRLTIGEQVTVKVIDFDIEKVRVSLGMKQLQPEPWVDIDEKYPVDSIIEGKIVNMMNYGAFIQLEEGVEGLIHISEMSWTRHIKHPSDMFKVGDKVEAKILNIDTDEKKISLGIKQLQDNPWDTIESKFEVGSDHDGIVRNLTQFGAFIELEEGIDGLVHVSDMSWVKQVRHPKEIVQKGDTIKVRILEVSAEDRRLALGIKQIEANPWENIKNDFTSGKVVNGTILKVLDKGIIFDLGEGLEGIVPLKRMKKHEKNSILTNFKEGDSHEVTVQEVDEEYKKIILMMDLGLDGLEGDDEAEPEMVVDEAEPEKLEIPQEVIDQISGNDEKSESEDNADEKSDDKDSVDE